MSQHRTLCEIAADLRERINSTDLSPQASAPLVNDAIFGTRALELFAAQFDANPVYRALCAARGAAPHSVTAWTNIPALPSSGFKDFEVTSLPTTERVAEFHSSGTTGHKPSRHFHNRESLSLYEASLWVWFRRHLMPNRGHHTPPELVALTPGPEQAPNSSLVYMFETVRQRLEGSTSEFFGTSTDHGWALDCERVLERLFALAPPAAAPSTPSRPVLLLATAISLLELLDFMAARKCSVRLPPGSRVMETGGYKGRSKTVRREQLHTMISHRLGVPMPFVISEYGMSELSSQAYGACTGPVRVVIPAESQSAPAIPPTKSMAVMKASEQRLPERVFQFPPWARARIISPETGKEVAEGETGLIQVFDLANVFSVMAIQTEDLGIRRGTGFELLGRASDVEPKGCSLHVAQSPSALTSAPK